MKFVIVLLSLCLTATAFPQGIKQLVDRNLDRDPAPLPRIPTSSYTALQQAALKGDLDAQKKLFLIIADHFEEVYASVGEYDSLFFSLRKMERGVYDDPSNNYAENIDALFKKTADKVTVNKRDPKVYTLDGKERLVDRINYQDDKITVEVKAGDKNVLEIPLTSLTERDRAFITSILIDNTFESDLEVSVEDSDEVEFEDRTGNLNLIVRTTESIDRYIILENEGDFPIHNLLVEYQSYLEQTLLDHSEDLPEDYALAGYSRIDSIEPGSQIKIEVPVLAALQERTENLVQNGYSYFHKPPPGTHPTSEGDIEGIWVKVHRITPYGEHLELSEKFKTRSKWNNVVPLSIDID